MDAFLQALIQSFSPLGLCCVLAGTIMGAVVGALPGLGAVVGITICLPFTFSMQPVSAIALLLGVYAGSIYGGSLSSILINTPGTPASAATALEGFVMAKRGQAGLALGWATASSVAGGLISCLILVLAAPQLARVALKFGPLETGALILMGLSCISTVSGDNRAKGLFSGVLGLSLALVGMDPISGVTRFTFGSFALTGGIDLIAVIVGIFALAEMLSRVDAIFQQQSMNLVQCSGLRLPPLAAWKGRGRLLLKSSLIGAVVGILPGAGAATAAFISYGEARRSSPRAAGFGHGEPDGIIASEAANNAVTGGALVPSLALGLPGDPVTAVMLATLILHGVVPGVRLMQDSPSVVYSSFLILSLATLLLLPVGWALTKGFARLLRIPESLLMCMIVILCALGTYGVRSNNLDLVVMLAAGGLGVLFRFFDVPAAPLVIGLVLGAQFERCLLQSVILTQGNWTVLFAHPIALGLLALALLMWFGGPAVRLWKLWRQTAV